MKNNYKSIFYRIITARLLSNFGSFLNMIALNIFILEKTNSAAILGMAFAVRVISGMLFSFISGYIADKYNRKSLMVISDIVLSFLMFVLVFIPSSFVIPYIIILMIFIGIFSNLFDISLQASIPVILNSDQTLKANSVLSAGRNVVIALSGLCAVFAKFIFKDFNSIFILDAITYALSAFVILSLSFRTNEEIKKTPVKPGLKEAFESYKSILKLPQAKVIFICLAILFIDALASASHNIGWPIFSKALNPREPMFYYGLILTFWACGNLLGIYLLNKLKFMRELKPEKLYIIFTAVMSLGMIMIFQTRFTAFIITASLIAGIGDGTYQTFYNTYIQKLDDSVRAKAFALTSFMLTSGFGIGFIIVPVVLNFFPVNITVLSFHGPVLLICIVYNLLTKDHGCKGLRQTG